MQYRLTWLIRQELAPVPWCCSDRARVGCRVPEVCGHGERDLQVLLEGCAD